MELLDLIGKFIWTAFGIGAIAAWIAFRQYFEVQRQVLDLQRKNAKTFKRMQESLDYIHRHVLYVERRNAPRQETLREETLREFGYGPDANLSDILGSDPKPRTISDVRREKTDESSDEE